MLKIAGIDEAGRGSVLGPLIVAGVSFSEDSIEKLPVLGVKDSKVLSSRKRKLLEAEIRDLAIGI